MELENIIKDFFNNDDEYSLIDIILKGEKKNKILEVYIDAIEPIDFDRLDEINRRVNNLLDNSDFKGEFLRITVSSPGAERPFKYIWQLKKHVGRNVLFGYEGNKISGKLIDIDTDKDTLTISTKVNKKETDVTYNFNDAENLIIKLPF